MAGGDLLEGPGICYVMCVCLFHIGLAQEFSAARSGTTWFKYVCCLSFGDPISREVIMFLCITVMHCTITWENLW